MGVCSFYLPWFHSDWGLVAGWVREGKGAGGGQGRHGQKPYDLLVSVLKKIKNKDMRRTGVDAQKAGRERKRLQRHTQKDMLNKCLKRCLKCGSRIKTCTSTQSKYFHAKKWYLKGGGGGVERGNFLFSLSVLSTFCFHTK